MNWKLCSESSPQETETRCWIWPIRDWIGNDHVVLSLFVKDEEGERYQYGVDNFPPMKPTHYIELKKPIPPKDEI